MHVRQLAEQALRLLPRAHAGSEQTVQPLPGVTLLRHLRPTAFEAVIYKPIVCLILQGKKETTCGEHTFTMRAGDCLVVSHDLPVSARVVETPYVVLLLDLELATLRQLYDEVAESGFDAADPHALQVHAAEPPILEALARYLALAGSPTDARVLGPSTRREVLYRLLTAPFGGVLRRLIRHDSHASAIARAIDRIRRDFRAPIAMPALAREIGMSESAFYKHFRAITSSTPLQYQKQLRLIEARRRLRGGDDSVSSVAFGVGYESASQFSREFKRMFGVPPARAS